MCIISMALFNLVSLVVVAMLYLLLLYLNSSKINCIDFTAVFWLHFIVMF